MILPFENEPYADFSVDQQRSSMACALDAVRRRLGLEYPLRIAGRPETAAERFSSINPSNPEQVIGSHPKATPAQAAAAVDAAARAFPDWSRTPSLERVRHLLAASTLLKRRKHEFNAWLVLEAGKSWIEAEAETSEAIDFCEYYAREMLRFESPPPLVQMPGEFGRLRYLPLGAGVIVAPWNFPLAILCGMTVAALVAGNTVIVKPSSETPTVGALFVDLLLEAGFPAPAIQFITGGGAAIGDTLVAHPRTRFISFTGSREVGLHINVLAARTQPGQIWIKRVIAEMGGKDAIIVDDSAELDQAAAGVVASAFGYQGQKCSACSRAIVHDAVYDRFLDMLAVRAGALSIGPAEDPAHALGPVISDRARRTILGYIEKGKADAKLITPTGAAVPDRGFYVPPAIFADVPPSSILFREEIFGPVLAVSRARDFEHALALANDSDYGLTGAVYSTSRQHLDLAASSFFVGNLYLNRKCTGAMVGAHPFGGFNMSGTDSKAGGPDYLLQFLQAKSIAEKL
ncbi:MAG: L-glutamate gamma-semialdehyde dehydrogenase [Bryobacteraceae bacterium]